MSISLKNLTLKISDIDECEEGNKCDTNAVCKNTDGSYSCQCKQDFTGNGRSCAGMIS